MIKKTVKREVEITLYACDVCGQERSSLCYFHECDICKINFCCDDTCGADIEVEHSDYSDYEDAIVKHYCESCWGDVMELEKGLIQEEIHNLEVEKQSIKERLTDLYKSRRDGIKKLKALRETDQ